MKLILPILVVMLCAVHYNCFSQDGDRQSIVSIPSKYFDKISKKVDGLNDKLDRKTEKVLAQLQKRQEKIKRKLYKIDSLAAKNIFTTADQRVKELEQRLSNPQKLTQYIPGLDTMTSSLKFLSQYSGVLGKSKEIQNALSKAEGLSSQLQKAEEVKQFLKQQKQFLKEQLSRFGSRLGGQVAKQLTKLNKDAYYYSQQVNEYKEILKDKKKIERKAIALLSKTKLFQDFMWKNSILASLFRMPSDDPNDPAYLQSLAGLQTRTQVNQLIQNQIGAGGLGAREQMQNNMQQAQGQLQQLKDKISKYGDQASDGDMPDFKPNNQNTKSFLKRLEWGINTQSQRSNGYFPVTSDLGLSLGYKINDKSIIGIGASYKLGWGENIQHIHITHQGAGLRSFFDYKLKKTLWISGGFEMNYRTEIRNIDQLRNKSAWQQSGLMGITKRIPVKTKFFKNTRLQLLWDFLSYRQVPVTNPVLFRVGYNF